MNGSSASPTTQNNFENKLNISTGETDDFDVKLLEKLEISKSPPSVTANHSLSPEYGSPSSSISSDHEDSENITQSTHGLTLMQELEMVTDDNDYAGKYYLAACSTSISMRMHIILL